MGASLLALSKELGSATYWVGQGLTVGCIMQHRLAVLRDRIWAAAEVEQPLDDPPAAAAGCIVQHRRIEVVPAGRVASATQKELKHIPVCALGSAMECITAPAMHPIKSSLFNIACYSSRLTFVASSLSRPMTCR